MVMQDGPVGCCPRYPEGVCSMVVGAPSRASAVFLVDVWLYLQWAARVLCSVVAAGCLGLGVPDPLRGSDGCLYPLLSTVHVRPVPCILHVHVHTHSLIYSCSSYSCCVVLWFETISIHSYVPCTCCRCCCCLCFVFFSVCVPAGAPGNSSPGFPTEAVGCFLFSSPTDVAASCPVLSCFYPLIY